MEESKNFPKTSESYHQTLYLFIYFIYLFIYLFISVNLFLLTIANDYFLEFKCFKTLLTYRSSKFLGVHPCMDLVSIKLQNSFVEIAFLHGCSPVGLLHVCRVSSLERTSERLLLNVDNFI